VTPPVTAWQLTEGSVLAGRGRVLLVQREAAGRTVYVVTEQGGRLTFGAEDPVDVVQVHR
jgi:hypothetical protein